MLAPDTDHQLNQETVNLCGPMVESRLDALVERLLKSEGLKRKYEELLLTTQTQVENIKSMSEMMSLPSRKLCAKHKFCISKVEIKDRLKELENKKMVKSDELKGRRLEKEQRHKSKFRNAARKVFENKKDLLCDDLHVILKEISNKKDGAMALWRYGKEICWHEATA